MVVDELNYREAPWTRWGKRVEGLMTSDEAIVSAGLDWDVSKTPIYTRNKMGQFAKIEDRYSIKNVVTDNVYGIVGKNYIPVQNREAFAFMDSLSQNKSIVYEIVGSTNGGQLVWVMARLPESFKVLNDNKEEITPYLLMVNSHGGTSALKVFYTPVRIICANMLARAESAKIGESFYARHTTFVNTRLTEAQKVLGLGKKFFNDYLEEANKLAREVLPNDRVQEFLNATFGQPLDRIEDDLRMPTMLAMEKVKELVETGRGLDNPHIKGTKWAYLNAVSEYTDHYRVYSGKDVSSAEITGTMFGTGVGIKDKARNYLLSMN